jgi:putative DNA primase/helicase
MFEVGEEGRYLVCACGYQFDTFLSRAGVSRKVPNKEDEEGHVRKNLHEVAHELFEKIMESETFATINGSEELYHYDGGVYVAGGEFRIKQLVQELAGQKYLGNTLASEVIGHVKRSTYVPSDKFYELTPYLVLNNGLLNVETAQVTPHSPDHHALSKLPVSYDPAADCPAIKRFLGEVLYPEDLPFTQEWIGYHLWRGYPVAVAALFVGEGSNGKSTLIGVLRAFLGASNIAAVPLQAFEKNTFAKATLFGKLANLYPDLSDSALKEVGTFKALTGGDTITAEKKFGQPFNLQNVAKLTFSCNIVPEVMEDTDAFFRRIWIVQFPNTFTGDRADPDLLSKLTTQGELSGVLNWALEGLKRLRTNRWHFTGTRSTAEVKADYIRRSDTVRAFLSGCTKKDTTSFVTRDDLYSAYCLYCRKRNLVARNRAAFFDRLPQFGQFNKTQRTVAGRRRWAVEGMALLPEEQWERVAADDSEPSLDGPEPVQPVSAVQEKLPDAQPAQDAHPDGQIREGHE